MAFELQAGQKANLTFQSNVPGANLHGLRFDFNPVQPLPNFPLQIYGDAFQAGVGFTNTGAFADYFDIEGYQNLHPPGNPPDYQLMIHKTVQTPAPNVFVYGWGTVHQVLWQVTVTRV
jgi:hypothetical protein